MSMFGGMEISASALTAQRLRMNVTAENLANAQTTAAPTVSRTGARRSSCSRSRRRLRRPAERGDGRRRRVAPGGVQAAAITEDQTNGKLVYDPSHPDANDAGLRGMPNVDTVTEMVDLIDAQRAYEANVTAMQASKQMFAKTLEILR